MSPMDVAARLGTVALLRFAAGLLVFVVLHLLRLPLLIAARVLEMSLHRVDRFVMAGLPTALGRELEVHTP